MATYLYNCRNCEQFLEVVRAMKDPEEIPNCENCEKLMSRIYTPAPITFNGSGFYKTGG